MRSRRYIVDRPSAEQVVGMARLRVLLAEQGYAIFPLIEKFRRHPGDFAAVLKNPPLCFLAVRQTKSGKISLTPFGPRSQYVYADRAVQRARVSSPAHIIWSGRQLHRPKNGEWWEVYFPKEVRLEVSVLIGL